MDLHVHHQVAPIERQMKFCLDSIKNIIIIYVSVPIHIVYRKR